MAWPALSQHALDLLRSSGEVLHAEPDELLWDAGDPTDLYLVLTGGVLLVDRRDGRVVFVINHLLVSLSSSSPQIGGGGLFGVAEGVATAVPAMRWRSGPGTPRAL